MLTWCAETAIVTAILGSVALLISRFRSATPSVKHALWLVVLIKFATPPLVCWPWAFDWRSLELPRPWLGTCSPAEVDGQRIPPAIADAPAADVQRTALVCESDPAVELLDGSPRNVPVAAALPALTSDATDPDPAPAPEPIAAASAFAPVPAGAREVPALSWRQSLPSADSIERGMLITWLVVSVAIGLGQAIRIMRFRRCLRGAVEAPDFLIDEAYRIGHWLGVDVPELFMVENLGTPLLWCLGRPQLLVPTKLVKTLPVERWRGILTHELAHLRRRDHWISRLELATGLIWWWNPLYWLTRSRLDAEAELACDAWVVWALPKDRLTYAEALFDICSSMSQAKSMAPMLGVAGSGRFFERRLTMILHNCVPCRLSRLGMVAACLLLLAALPSWSAAKLVELTRDGESVASAAALTLADTLAKSVDDDDKDDKAAKRAVDDDDDDDADDDDDDDADDDDDDDDEQDAAALTRAKARAEAARARVEAIERKLEASRGRKQEKAKDKAKDKDNTKTKTKKAAKPDSERDLEVDLSRLEKELEAKFGEGSEFAEKMEKLGEKIGKELEEKLGSGSEFEKQMEKLGETIGKEMESKFGPGSDFEKQMEKLGKDLEGKLGDGSEFAEKMKSLGKEMESKFGPGSEFEQKMKKLGDEIKDRVESDVAKKAQGKAASSAKSGAKARGANKDADRERHIKELEARIAELMGQIKELKSQTDKD
jgi:beta-lactamase regulating signal transducer with metallopeptidase domain